MIGMTVAGIEMIRLFRKLVPRLLRVRTSK